MMLPNEIPAATVKERIFCDETQGGTLTLAENIDLTALPRLRPRAGATAFRGIAGEMLQFFCNGERAVALTRDNGAYFAQIFDVIGGSLVSLALPAPQADGFLYAHTWRFDRLYLPAFGALIDTKQLRVLRTDRPLLNGSPLMEHREDLVAKNQHIVIFEDKTDFSCYPVGESVRVDYQLIQSDQILSCYVKIVAVDADLGEITLQGEDATKIIYAVLDTVTLHYDIPRLTAMMADHDRVYGYHRNRIYISAKDERGVRFGSLEEDSAENAPHELEMTGEITGCCMYRGRPVFFTDAAVITLIEDVELGLRVTQTPTVGVSPRAVTSPAVIGSKICYFSRYGLAVYDGRSARVVHSDIGAPTRGGAAVADGCFYSFVAADGQGGEALYAYDIEHDALYCMGDASEAGICFALGGVLVGSRFDGLETELLIFTDRESLPYPISEMAEQGIVQAQPAKALESRADFAEDREPCGDFGPFSLVLDAALGEGGELTLSLFYDGEAIPAAQQVLRGPMVREVRQIALAPRRCKSYRLGLAGKGEFSVFGVKALRRI
ncbi:MAG: hypothetical protein IKD28_05865 [Clostridia bacterium]|nr:hypothetical protein [Clostridia bacterium]